MNKKRYVPDLQRLHSLAERNYAALQRLLTQSRDEPVQREILVGDQLRFQIEEKTSARYTTDLAIAQTAPDTHDFVKASFIVRLYHDARMAEIIDCQGQERLTALTLTAANPAYPRDEKLQLNQHLADWLKLCFQTGRTQYEFNYVG